MMTPEQILSLPGAERLREWAEIGPVQRAAVETVMEAVWNAALEEAKAAMTATCDRYLGEPEWIVARLSLAIKNLKEPQP